MTINELTHKQATALARFVHELRGDWDVPGIEYALGKARSMAPAPDVAVAAIKAAKVAANRTPSVIAMEGAHWRGSESKPRYETPPKAETCSTCYQRRDVCRSRWVGDHEFEPLTQVHRPHEPSIEAARETLATTRRELCTHGVDPRRCADHRTPAPTDPTTEATAPESETR